MVSAAVGVIGPLTFVVVLELARLAREVQIVPPDTETTRITYDEPNGWFDRAVRWLATRVGYSQSIVSAGGFFVVFYFTEVILLGSIMFVYGLGGPLFLAPEGQEPLTNGVVIVFLGLLWIALPVIVVDRYDEVTAAGIEPFSVNIHGATTGVTLLLVVAGVESQALGGSLPTWLPVDREFLGAVGGGTLLGLSIAKSKLFYQYLRAELARLDSASASSDDPSASSDESEDAGTGEVSRSTDDPATDGTGGPSGATTE